MWNMWNVCSIKCIVWYNFFREKVSPLFVILLNRLIYNDKFHNIIGNIIIHYKDEVLIF